MYFGRRLGRGGGAAVRERSAAGEQQRGGSGIVDRDHLPAADAALAPHAKAQNNARCFISR